MAQPVSEQIDGHPSILLTTEERPRWSSILEQRIHLLPWKYFHWEKKMSAGAHAT